MNERAVSFGPERGLLGILTQTAAHRDGIPTVILLNAGLLHRVGPNRLSVDIARSLADLGYPCLRFDTSGVGDSELIEGGLLDIERSCQEVIEAMDALRGGIAKSCGWGRVVRRRPLIRGSSSQLGFRL